MTLTRRTMLGATLALPAIRTARAAPEVLRMGIGTSLAKLDPLLTYIAVRHAGYWADGFLALTASPSATLTHAQDALKAMIATARIGASVAELKQAAEAKLSGLAVHPSARKLVSGIGLALEETEAEPGGVTRLEEGRIYTLRAGAGQSETDNALVSAMIEPKAGSAEILWSSLR